MKTYRAGDKIEVLCICCSVWSPAVVVESTFATSTGSYAVLRDNGYRKGRQMIVSASRIRSREYESNRAINS